MKAYDYMRELHDSDESYSNTKEQQEQLVAIVGQENLSTCFQIDQLIFVEDAYLKRRV